MKLSQILEYEFPAFRERSSTRLPDQHKYAREKHLKPGVLRNKKVKHVGSGAFASTYSHQDRPEDVRRISRSQTFKDGYWVYVQALKDHPDNSNPYFPKFREGTEYHQRSGHVMTNRSVLSVKMERLRRLHELDNIEIESVFERWFGEQWKKSIATIYGEFFDLNSWSEPSFVLIDIMRREVENQLSSNSKIIDRQLVDALKFIRELVYDKSRGGEPLSLDFGTNNIMYKRSPYGIQLVITDPVA